MHARNQLDAIFAAEPEQQPSQSYDEEEQIKMAIELSKIEATNQEPEVKFPALDDYPEEKRYNPAEYEYTVRDYQEYFNKAKPCGDTPKPKTLTPLEQKQQDLQVDQLLEMFPGSFRRDDLSVLLDQAESFDQVFSSLLEFVTANEQYRNQSESSDDELPARIEEEK